MSCSTVVRSCSPPPLPCARLQFRCGAPKALDPDADGTLDLAEAKKAGGALFDKLDKDHEGTLDIKELKGRVTKADLAGADPTRTRP